MSLSSLIVQREVATMRQVEEALARQVIYGGDLVTNLLEVARVDEAVLGQLLAESVELAPAPTGPLPDALDAVRALVPVEMALERSIVPIGATAETLVLAVADRLPEDFRDQLAFALGMRIEERAAPAVRVWQAIAAAYGAPLDRRMQRLVSRLAGDAVAVAALSFPPPLEPAPSPRAVRPRSVPPARTSTPPPPPRASNPPPPSIATPSSVGGTPGRRATLTSFPAGRVSAVPAAPPPPIPEAARSDPTVTRSLAETRSGPSHRAVAGAARVGRRRRGPLTFATARHDADEADDRDTLFSLFFDFSRQFFEYAALFLVQGDIAEGRDGFGSGATRERVLGVGVPLDLPSLLARARDTRVPVVGNGPAEGLDAALLADLQRPSNAEIVVVPLVVRTRAVALFVGDCGDSGLDWEAIDQVTAFCTVVSKAFERIIVRRKLEGFVAGSRGAPAGVPTAMLAPQVAKRPSSAPPAVGPAPAVPLDASGEPIPLVPRESPEVALDESAEPAGPDGRRDSPTAERPPATVGAAAPVSDPPITREEPLWFPEQAEPVTADPIVEARGGRMARAPQLRPLEGDAELNSPFDEAWLEAGHGANLPPASAIVVPPHRPPSARSRANDELPSVMVDVTRELEVVVDRLLAGESDDQAEGELLRQGEHAMRVLMARFPGPLTIDRVLLGTLTNPPRASECGPLLRLIARERKVALPFVLTRMSDPDPEVRGWATHLLCELPYPDALPHLLGALCNGDQATRASAALAIGVLAKGFGELVLEALGEMATGSDPFGRAAALRAVGEVREPALVPELIRSLGDTDGAVVAAARDALVRTTRQDFGNEARRWSDWWEHNGRRDRLEWLIDALSHELADVRKASGEELRLLSRQYFGYASDLPPRDRERAQQRYRDWWITEGRAARRWA